MGIIGMYWACLFNREPTIGDIDPEGEIFYTGYSRVPFAGLYGKNLTEIVFPESKQEVPVFASHVVVVGCSGKVVSVKAL